MISPPQWRSVNESSKIKLDFSFFLMKKCPSNLALAFAVVVVVIVVVVVVVDLRQAKNFD